MSFSFSNFKYSNSFLDLFKVSCVLKNIHCFASVYDLFVVAFKLGYLLIFYSSIIGEMEININCLKQKKNKSYSLNQNFLNWVDGYFFIFILNVFKVSSWGYILDSKLWLCLEHLFWFNYFYCFQRKLEFKKKWNTN